MKSEKFVQSVDEPHNPLQSFGHAINYYTMFVSLKAFPLVPAGNKSFDRITFSNGWS